MEQRASGLLDVWKFIEDILRKLLCCATFISEIGRFFSAFEIMYYILKESLLYKLFVKNTNVREKSQYIKTLFSFWKYNKE